VAGTITGQTWSGAGIVFDAKTGRQSVVLSIENAPGKPDAEQRLSRVGNAWRRSGESMKVSEDTLLPRKPARNVAPEIAATKLGLKDTPLHDVAGDGDLAQVTALLAQHPEWLNARDKQWMTPLFYAAINAHADVLKELLAHGAALDATDYSKNTILSVVASQQQKESREIAALLLEHKAPGTHTALAKAIEFGRADVVELFLSHGVDAKMTDKYGGTPLHLAAIHGRVDAAKILLAHGAIVNAKTKDGQTPLALALERRQKEMAAFLRENEAGE